MVLELSLSVYKKNPKGIGHMGFSIAVGLTIASGSKWGS